MGEFADIFAFDLTTTVYLSVSAGKLLVYALTILVSILPAMESDLTPAPAL